MVDVQTNKINKNSTYQIAIVGLGPKGLYSLERLLAQIAYKKIESKIEIHLFNSNEYFGSGAIYAKDQPHYLLMNYSSSNINAWIDESPAPIIAKPDCFQNWLLEQGYQKESTIYKNYAPRAVVGQYLQDVFIKLIEASPENVSIYVHNLTVSDITRTDEKFQIETTENSSFSDIDDIMLTTGHQSAGADFNSFPDKTSKIEFVYPTSIKLKKVGKGNIAIRGFGLTCIDTVLELTEGRGGRFVSRDSRYEYLSSEKEPNKLYIISRSGLPMIPRTGNKDEIDQLYYFTEKNIEKETDRTFLGCYLPLIKKEIFFHFYRTLFRKHEDYLRFEPDFKKVEEQISKFHFKYPDLEKFSWESFVNPFLGQDQISHEEMLNYLRYLVDEAEKGIEQSSIISAAAVWRKISPIFNKYYSFGKLDADSHRTFDTEFFGIFNRIAYGPPIENYRKFITLGESGILDFSMVRNSEIEENPDGTFFLMKNPSRSIITESQHESNSEKISIDVLIDARIPKGIDPKLNRLYSNLIEKGLLRKFTNVNDGTFITGGIEVNPNGNAINSQGEIEQNISLYGTPTEGITHDNDTLSRTRNNLASEWARRVSEHIQHKTEKTL